jgi:KDO2-lipid IV(A) lauroyltransferase
MHFVPANIQGVRQVARALQRGQAVGILPDQVPGDGDGVWVPFFGKLAYTAVLPAKLATKNQVPTIIFSATRKKIGLGWTIRAMRINKPFDADPSIAAEELNRAIEEVILKCPEQYLWGYNRYKQPAGAPSAPSPQS